MWKANTNLEKDIAKAVNSTNDDDWNTDPDFVNAVSEKDQRWGNQKTISDNSKETDPKTLADLRREVVTHHETKVKQDWIETNGKQVKASYGAPAVAK